ncbi:MAG: glycoside hydrolase family 99-like domain-containing protein, partial [Phycisphaerae bacterium]|nr:glycoside hydrolase family 99-like domain-containing protein [Phycisphaerae bacterium]
LVRTNPRPRLFHEMCVKAKRYVDPKLRMILAECWNEFGEGAYIEPTARFGFGWLDAMRDAFCGVNPHHDDVVPAALGLPVPTFDQIPEPMAKLIARGGNLLFNGDVESQWGWVLFDGTPAPRVTPAKQGQWCLRIPAGQGVKTEWRMPVPKDRSVQIHLQYRVPVGSKLVVQLALFRETAWLGRYAPAATIDGKADHWGKLRGRVRIDDAEATHVDIEFTAAGGDAYVDDVDIRAPGLSDKPHAP